MKENRYEEWKFDKKRAVKSLEELSVGRNVFRDDDVFELVQVINRCNDLEEEVDKLQSIVKLI